MAAGAQRGEALGRIAFLEDRAHLVCQLAGAGAVVLGFQIQHLDLAAGLAIDACAALLAQRAFGNQCGQPLGLLEIAVPGIVGQVLVHGADHMRQRIQADHVGGAIGGALGTADLRAGQRVDFVEAQAQAGGVMHGRQDREHADPVGDEIGGVQRADHALAQRRREPGFELVQHARFGVRGGDDLDQPHVARRVEEMDAAEAVAQLLGQGVAQRVDRQPGGVRGDDGAGRHVRRDALVQRGLPVHALGDGLDDQVAALQPFDMVVIVGGLDQGQARDAGQRRGFELLQAGQRLLDDAVAVAFFGGEVEQRDGHAGVGQVGGDLCAHDAGTQHGDVFNDELAQGSLQKCPRLCALLRLPSPCRKGHVAPVLHETGATRRAYNGWPLFLSKPRGAGFAGPVRGGALDAGAWRSRVGGP